MSQETTIKEHLETHVTDHDHDHDHGHHDHHQSFISKYIFSTDHKTIAKQFLVTGIIWAIVGGGLSVLFRYSLVIRMLT